MSEHVAGQERTTRRPSDETKISYGEALEVLKAVCEAAWDLYPHRTNDIQTRRNYVIANALVGELTWHGMHWLDRKMQTEFVDGVLGKCNPANNEDEQQQPGPQDQNNRRGQASEGAKQRQQASKKNQKTMTEMADDQAAAHKRKRNVYKSRLDTFLIHGRPIGDCTVSEVWSWIDARTKDHEELGRDLNYARKLVEGLQMTAKVRKVVSAAQADSLYNDVASV